MVTGFREVLIPCRLLLSLPGGEGFVRRGRRGRLGSLGLIERGRLGPLGFLGRRLQPQLVFGGGRSRLAFLQVHLVPCRVVMRAQRGADVGGRHGLIQRIAALRRSFGSSNVLGVRDDRVVFFRCLRRHLSRSASFHGGVQTGEGCGSHRLTQSVPGDLARSGIPALGDLGGQFRPQSADRSLGGRFGADAGGLTRRATDRAGHRLVNPARQSEAGGVDDRGRNAGLLSGHVGLTHQGRIVQRSLHGLGIRQIHAVGLQGLQHGLTIGVQIAARRAAGNRGQGAADGRRSQRRRGGYQPFDHVRGERPWVACHDGQRADR